MGSDEFAAVQEAAARKDGMGVRYLRVAGKPTGTCAVLVGAGGERSLVASLGAAESYSEAHLDGLWAELVLPARVFYISSFFMTHSAAVILRLGAHAAAEARLACGALSQRRVAHLHSLVLPCLPRSCVLRSSISIRASCSR